MAVELPTIEEVESEAGPGAQASRQPWPSRAVAWYAVAIFAVVLMLGQMESSVINFLVAPIKKDFGLADWQMGLLIGVAPAIFYALVGLPMARLVDTMRRNVILGVGLGVTGLMTSVSGLAQTFLQFAVCRVAVGGGGAVNGPGTYSMMADYFPRERLPRAIAFMQIGFILGRSFAPALIGTVAAMSLGWAALEFNGLSIRNWQQVFLLFGAAGVFGSILMFTVKEPPRRGLLATPGNRLTMWQTLVYLGGQWRLYTPQFLALAFSAAETYGLEAWRPTFLQRTYGWGPAISGQVLGFAALGAQLLGLLVGTPLTEWLAKRRDDANLRAVAIFYSIVPLFAIIGPLMPNPWLAVACSSITGMCGLAGAVPQNAALQSVTPNEMRGQITAIYLFIFSVIGLGIGPAFMSFITDFVIGDEQKIRYAMSISAAVMTPIAAIIMWTGVKRYGQAITEIKAREAAGHV
jgi:MFS family permease